MKKYLIIFFLLLTSNGWCQQGAVMSGCVASGVSGVSAACGTLGSQETAGSSRMFGTTTVNYIAIEFTPSTSGVVHQMQVKLKDGGDPSANPVHLYICDSDGQATPAPTASCTEADNTVTAGNGTNNTTNGTANWKYFNFAAGVPVSTGTYYFIKVYSAQTNDTINYYIDNISTGSEQTSISQNGSAWTSVDASSTATFRITSCSSWE